MKLMDEIRKQAAIDVQKKPNRNFCLNEENQASTPVQSAPSKQNIPKWIKNNIEWWSVGQIDDLAFLTGIEFLVKEKIIVIEIPEKSEEDLRYESAVPSGEMRQVPEWVKNNAGWWVDGQIPDSAFIDGIEYLIKQEIIIVPITEAQSEDESKVPEWIKTNAGWWADGQIDDKTFATGIEYLIKSGLIVV